MNKLLIILLLSLPIKLISQTNISFSNPKAAEILKGNYQGHEYHPFDLNDNSFSYCQFKSEISADSLRENLEKLSSFENRNTFSDTSSSVKGIGAARRWAMEKFTSYDVLKGSPNQGDSYELTYLDFDVFSNSCGPGHLRNVIAIRPGYVPDMPITIVQAHMDSRCGGRCDTACVAHGADDNGSGTVIVMELVRIFAKKHYPGTIVFMLTAGEEQGLLGAIAFAEWCFVNDIKVQAVLNNDIIGGIFCGETASPPSTCAAEGSIDSSRLRVFAASSEQLGSRNQARWIKLNYEKFLAKNVDVPMQIQIMNQEDRTGRGGDHIPFRQRGFNATRFTSAVEHGNGAGNSDPNYHDRQHSTDDVIGIDTNNDGEIDSLFIDFNYLARNAVVNATMVSLASIADTAPTFTIDPAANGGATISLEGNTWQGAQYLVGIRQTISADTSLMFDHIYAFSDSKDFVIPGILSGEAYFVSLAKTSVNNPIGIWSSGQLLIASQTTDSGLEYELPYADCNTGPISVYEFGNALDFRLAPNPAQDALSISPDGVGVYDIWEFRLRDIQGRNIISQSYMGPNQVKLSTRFVPAGVYLAQFILKGKVVENKKLIIKH